jgi:hypothetical protein
MCGWVSEVYQFRIAICERPIPVLDLTTRFKLQDRHAAGHLRRREFAKVLSLYAFVEQSISYKREQIAEFAVRQMNGSFQQRIEPLQDGLDRPEAVSQVRGQPGRSQVQVILSMRHQPWLRFES